MLPPASAPTPTAPSPTPSASPSASAETPSIPGGGTVDAFFYTQINLISEVSGTVYRDLNANGVYDSGEPTATSDASGNFRIWMPK